MNYPIETVSYGMICIPSLMNIDTGVQAIIRFYFRNLRGCNIGITNETVL
jgi:hypothetical protein